MPSVRPFQLLVDQYARELRFLQRRPVRNLLRVRAMHQRVQFLNEAQRDPLTTAVLNRTANAGEIDRNSYKTYDKQVETAYKMYDGLTNYGSELFAALADTRVAFIAGEGVSFHTENKAKSEFIKNFLRRNNLNGSKLLAAVLMGELEGKVLFVLAARKDETDDKKSTVDARLFSWYANKYVVNRDKQDYEKVLKIAYKGDGGKDEEISLDKSTYVKLGGCNYKDDSTPTRLGKVLTQCENASRATYDLRKNTHIFGKVMPVWETPSGADAKAINADLEAKSFEIGDGYAGTGKMSLLEPSGGASDAIIKDFLCSLRYVASMSGIPIHWLAWPDLMSNRATAENMLEVVSAATKKERLIWEEALTSMIEKVCIMAVDATIAENKILDGDVTVKLPLVSLAALQQLTDVWQPLWESKLISTLTFRNMLPGIDPEQEEALVKKEKEAAGKQSPFNNDTVNKALEAARLVKGNGGQDGGDGTEQVAQQGKGGQGFQTRGGQPGSVNAQPGKT